MFELCGEHPVKGRMLPLAWAFIQNCSQALISWPAVGAIAAGLQFAPSASASFEASADSTTVVLTRAVGFVTGAEPFADIQVVIGVNQRVEAERPFFDQHEKFANQLASEKGVEVAPLRAILMKLIQAGVQDEDIPKRLAENANEFVKMRGRMIWLRQGPPEISLFAQQADQHLSTGDFVEARAALVSGRNAAHALREQALQYEAEFLAQEARVDHLQLAYRSAATKFAAAARLMEAVDPRQQWNFVLAQAAELVFQGDVFADNTAPAQAMSTYRAGLSLAPRSHRPVDWARTQSGLGDALAQMGQGDTGTVKLREAVAAYRDALSELTRARAPLDWAQTQNNLGLALTVLGMRGRETARLEEAVAAFGEALQERTREGAPLEWAETQINLGTALATLGSNENRASMIQEAVAAFRRALYVLTRERVPLQWATIHYKAGILLSHLGQAESGTDKLEEAVGEFSEALKERTRERAPLDWALSLAGQGMALTLLAQRRGDEAMAESALAQIETGLATARDRGDPKTAAFLAQQLNVARNVVAKIRPR
jgi:tetratricopeptide (TPR) repeat protein